MQLLKKHVERYFFRGRNIPQFTVKATSRCSKPWIAWLQQVNQFYLNNLNKNKDVISPMFVNVPQDSRPYIRLRILGREVVALLDSGASQSILGRDGIRMIKDLKLTLNKVCHRQVTTADGKLQPILGSCDIPIQISGVCRIVNFLAVPSVEHSIIVGSDFCNLFQVNVDYNFLAVPSVEHSIIVGSDFCNLFQVNVDYKDGRWTIQCKENPLSVDYQSFQLSALQMIQSHSFTPEEQIQVDNVLASFKRINGSDTFLGRTDKLIHHIDTGDEKPFKQRQYPFSPILMQHLNKELDKMLELGIIERSHGLF
ncbi:hypothetical protein QE152_g13443 [Popillia japonica]|uniref:Peptidase A2 domain-containing protein n=1 Tax=Popillia japonica TaxID=7064 RepID=A0AAW1L9Q7_POPJA